MTRSIMYTGRNCGEVRELVGRDSMGCIQPIILDHEDDWVLVDVGQQCVEVASGKWKVTDKNPRQIVDWSVGR